MGRASPNRAQAREERKRSWTRRRPRRRPSSLNHLLGCLETEFPESLGELVCDPDQDPVDGFIELIARLLRERDPRARLLAEVLLEAYPYRPIAHWLWGRALAQAGAYARAAAALRNLLQTWPDFPGRASVQQQLDSLP